MASSSLIGLSGAPESLRRQPDKGALPRMGRDASFGTLAAMPRLVLIACEVRPL